MSQELERVYTINLGKVKLSQSQHRAVRAINMIREFARHHMKVETIKIEEELAQQIWSKGVRSPPRKIRVRMTKTDEGFILVSRYDEEVESKAVTESKSEKVVDEVEAPKTPEPAKE
ncbi:MAG: 60S ribosomal protein L31, partial [Nitrosopumilus sp.]|nr:60S ribosomal protein L31 [Nitrosopumilus sp.]